MDLFEHQARELFDKYGVLTPRAEVTDSPEEARGIARRLGGRVVVKAQVRTGGRGRAGGVRLAADPAEAGAVTRRMLGADIKGHTVRSVMLAQPVDVETEFYVSYVLDRAAGRFLAVASAEGGTDIEDVAATRREAVVRVPVDPAEGVTTAVAARIADAAGLPPHTVDTLVRLWRVLTEEDALLIEVNPLVRTRQGQIVALDGKVTLDDNALFRHGGWGAGEGRSAAATGVGAGAARQATDIPEASHAPEVPRGSHAPEALVREALEAPAALGAPAALAWEAREASRAREAPEALEALAAERGLTYVKLDGEVGVIGNGAGLVMSTLDVVAGCGARPANFLDIGGGASARVMADGLSTVLADPGVRSVLVNVFGGITACDTVAEGIVRALDEVRLTRPLVVRLDGNNAARGRAVLAERAHPLVEQATTMDGAARRAAELARAT
ncbi:ATP-grasp domain-containing protein [Streptomyces sp. NPDC002734]|uniref:ATP-grasp domain-containing protein n=1 Tax=Streptomyces sp. NPDC002734 TaxID=3154426 RepID=UPI0033236887